jgi:hypothetical protein
MRITHHLLLYPSPSYEWQIGVFQKRFGVVSAKEIRPIRRRDVASPALVTTMRDEDYRAVCWLLTPDTCIPFCLPTVAAKGRVARDALQEFEDRLGGHGEQRGRKADAEQVRRGKTSILQTAQRRARWMYRTRLGRRTTIEQ